MIIAQLEEWETFLFKKLDDLMGRPRIEFSRVTPKILPQKGGVYLITRIDNANEEPYYIGRTTNLRERLYRNHLMGSTTNARLKKYLIDDKTCKDVGEAKEFIKKYCAMRWIEENDSKTRGYIEHFFYSCS
jgi:predicted GIY-YIG superfamily endonuclease